MNQDRARLTDGLLAAWNAECKAIQKEWHQLDAEAERRHPRANDTPTNRGFDDRNDWLIAARRRLAEDVEAGRFAVKVPKVNA